MKTATEIRRDNLRKIETAIGGRGELCNAIGKSEKYVSQLIGANPIRGIGDTLARSVEASTGLERGWLDNLHHRGELPENAAAIARKWLSLDDLDQKAIAERIDVLLTIKQAASGLLIRPNSPNYEKWEASIVQDIKGRYMSIQKKQKG